MKDTKVNIKKNRISLEEGEGFDFESLNFLDSMGDPNLQLPDPALVQYYNDIQRRIIYITQDVSESLFDEIRLIMRWNYEDEEANIPVEERIPIKLMIYSYGGDLHMALAFIDYIKLSKTPIITVNCQVAMSAGCDIFIAGHKRYCLKNSWALIHEGSGGYSGTYSQAQAQANNYKKLMEMTNNLLMENTKIDKKTLTKWKGKEIFLDSEEQIKYGLADSIVENIKDII